FATRVFTVNSGTTVSINDLTIEAGQATDGNGGGILNKGDPTPLRATGSRRTPAGTNRTSPTPPNTPGARGRSSHAPHANLPLSQSTVSGNTAQGGAGQYAYAGGSGGGGAGLAGGIFNAGSLTVVNSTISGNTAVGGAGADGSAIIAFEITQYGGNGGGNG